MVEHNAVKQWVVAGIILSVFVLAFVVLAPIIIPIVVGLLFAYIFSPVYKVIHRRFKWRNLSAFILIFAILFLVVGPIIYFAPSLVEQVLDTYSTIQKFDITAFASQFLDADITNLVEANLSHVLSSFFSKFLNQFSTFLINLPSFILQVVVFLFTFFFAIRDSDKLKTYISSLSPFSNSTEEKFLKEFRGITNAIIFGQVLIGVVQGLALGAGLFFLGVPKALALSVIAGLVSIIPVLGSWLVWLPTSILLLVGGQTFEGIFLLLYGAIFISSLDNLIRPIILAKSSTLPVSVSVIGTIGGLYVFGLLGLVLGPLILAYALIIVDFYRQGKLNELFKK